jgi:hypothetical protein
MTFLLLSFTSRSLSVFLELNSVFFPPGLALERFFATREVTFLFNLSISPNPKLRKLSVFLLSESDAVPTAFCAPGRAPTLSVSASGAPNRFTAAHESLYRLALVNCGPSSIVVSGSVSAVAPHGHLDLRLEPLIPIFVLFASAFVAFTILWTWRLLRANPEITVCQQMFTLTTALATVGAAVFLIFLVLWHTRGVCLRALLALSALTTAASRALLAFLTFSGLQEPSELPPGPFVVIGVFLGFGFLVEQFGIVEFNTRSTGIWPLGFGRIPYLQFVLLGGVQLVLLIWAARAPPPESRGSRQRSGLLLAYAIIVFVFLGTSLATAALRTDAKLGSVIEWWPFIIEPMCFAALAGATGVFWMVFNAHGWEMLDNQTSSTVESGGPGESLIDADILPRRGPESIETLHGREDYYDE